VVGRRGAASSEGSRYGMSSKPSVYEQQPQSAASSSCFCTFCGARSVSCWAQWTWVCCTRVARDRSEYSRHYGLGEGKVVDGSGKSRRYFGGSLQVLAMHHLCLSCGA